MGDTRTGIRSVTWGSLVPELTGFAPYRRSDSPSAICLDRRLFTQKTPLPRARDKRGHSHIGYCPARCGWASLRDTQRRPLRILKLSATEWLCAAVTRPPSRGPALPRGPIDCPVVPCSLHSSSRRHVATAIAHRRLQRMTYQRTHHARCWQRSESNVLPIAGLVKSTISL